VAESVNLVVTCSERKTRRPPAHLSARSLAAKDLAGRAAEWIGLLAKADVEVIPAKDLYIGNHWHAVRSAVENAQTAGLDLKVWIVSAGYGLIPFRAPIKSYAATFSNGPDRVTRGGDATKWWNAIAEWAGPSPGFPRTLADIAKQAPRVPMIVATSASYLRAIEQDIMKVQEILTPTRLAVISAGLDGYATIEPSLMHCDRRFLPMVGGSKHTLNARLAAYSLSCSQEWYPDGDQLRAKFAQLFSELPVPPTVTRRNSSDDDVRAFISSLLITDRARGYTVFLRAFRSSGSACEQKRFKRLYTSIVNGSTQ
jgi:hypothetical protein